MKTRLLDRSVLPSGVHEGPAKCLLAFGSLLLIGFGISGGNSFVVGCGTMMVGLLVLFRVVVDMRRGETSSNWGTWRRIENRTEFRCNVCFWAGVTVLLLALGASFMLGFVPLHSVQIGPVG